MPEATNPTEPGFESPRTLLINCVVAAVLATWLMIPIHELVHVIADRLNGFAVELYPFAVLTVGERTATQVAVGAISAPIFSLVSGLVMAFWLPLRRIGGFAHLLWLWFAFVSLMEGVGYLVITPFDRSPGGVEARGRCDVRCAPSGRARRRPLGATRGPRPGAGRGTQVPGRAGREHVNGSQPCGVTNHRLFALSRQPDHRCRAKEQGDERAARVDEEQRPRALLPGDMMKQGG